MISIYDLGCHAARRIALAGFAFALLASGAQAEPSSAQLSAVKSNCRSDYMANCSSVRPGGKEALQCLQQHVDSLTGACQSAVRATILPPPAAAAPPPAPPPPKAASAPPPPAAVAPPEQAAPAPPKAATAPKPKKTTTATPMRAPAPPPPVAVAPPPPAYSMAKIDQLQLRQLAAIERSCDDDREAVCPLVRPGGGRIVKCLAQNSTALSPRCKRAMAAALR